MPTAEIQAKIPLRADRVLLTHIITDIGATEPRTERLDVRGGFLHLRLTEYPVFIEPLGRGFEFLSVNSAKNQRDDECENCRR